ncbi:hypothetical protein [Caloramator australicus]|uniref:Uncharacterized protein n=1 Tax=Caloramator australicus RC3 TaxID=857293 RepID=I7KSY5_9CLOT|nr:hypothetical protein [Caloramator australicus]CCJ32778.1 hypothetical protein CAAU_0694 [Caloramator australicus RC3]
MWFIIITLIIWGFYVFYMKKQFEDGFRFSETLIPLIFLCIITAICLGVNFVASVVPSLNDGIAIHNFLAKLIIGDEKWSVQLFKLYFDWSVYVSIFLILIYSIIKVNKR